MNLETEIYQILRHHKLGLKKREEIIVDLLDFINKRDKQLNIGFVGSSFDFVEWCGINYIRLHEVWVHRFKDQTNKDNWLTTSELQTIYNKVTK